MASRVVTPTIDYLQTGATGTTSDTTYGAPRTDGARSWLERVHPDYRRHLAEWTYADDHYTANVLQAQKLKHYLVRKGQGESDDSYSERLSLADYTNHFAVVVDSLVGMVSAIEGDATRRFTSDENAGLGDHTDPDTVAGRLWRDADGDGAGWLTLWKQFGVLLTVLHRGWVLVDVVNESPRIKLLSPVSVKNWRMAASGHLAEALVCEKVDARTSLTDETPADDAFTEQYIHYTLDGWQRWALSERGQPIRLNRAGRNDSGTYTYTAPDGNRALPIFPVSLPLRRMVGYTLARKCNVIFNKESERDNLLRLCGFPKLNVVGSREAFEMICEDLRVGANVLHVPTGNSGHDYITADVSPAAVMTEVLKRKVEEFYIVAFREYGDAARERTATEVRQDTSAGVGAYLTLFTAALDNAEQGAMWRVEQSVFPNDVARHGVARVERSLDFAPLDPDAVIDKQNARAFGDAAGVPLGFAAQRAASAETLRHQGLTVDEGQVVEAVRSRAVLDALTTSPDLPIPAAAKSALAISVLVAAGYLDAAEMTTTPSGEPKPPTLDRAATERDSLKVAEAHEMFHLREGQSFPGANGEDGEDDEDEDTPPRKRGGAPPPDRE